MFSAVIIDVNIGAQNVEKIQNVVFLYPCRLESGNSPESFIGNFKNMRDMFTEFHVCSEPVTEQLGLS